MISPQEYISLESACASLKSSGPAVLLEIARQILAVAIPESEFEAETICVLEGGQPKPDAAITYAEIGSYLMMATGKHVPVLFDALSGSVESNRVFMSRDWIKRRISMAQESLRLSARLSEAAANQNLSLVLTAGMNSNAKAQWEDQPLPMSAPGYKKLRRWLAHQNDQRKANESASRLAILLQDAVARAEKAELITDVKNAEINVLLNRDRLQIMEISALQRTVQSLTTKNLLLEESAKNSATADKAKKPTAKSKARAAAREIATSRWLLPDFNDYRIGQMALDVWAEMSSEESEHKNAMPLHHRTVIDWLKEDKTPEAASRPGRPPKPKNNLRQDF